MYNFKSRILEKIAKEMKIGFSGIFCQAVSKQSKKSRLFHKTYPPFIKFINIWVKNKGTIKSAFIFYFFVLRLYKSQNSIRFKELSNNSITFLTIRNEFIFCIDIL